MDQSIHESDDTAPFGDVDDHSAKALFVVRAMERLFSCLRATTSKSKSAWRTSYER